MFKIDTIACIMDQEQLEKLWEAFGDIGIDDDDNITEPFMDWPEGTNRFDIWHWFDAQYDGGVWALMAKEA